MEYAGTALGQQVGGQQAVAAPIDLAALRGRLEERVKQAEELAHRAADVADRVLGCQPLSAGKGTEQDRPPSSLVDLVNDLGRELSRIQSALNRL